MPTPVPGTINMPNPMDSWNLAVSVFMPMLSPLTSLWIGLGVAGAIITLVVGLIRKRMRSSEHREEYDR